MKEQSINRAKLGAFVIGALTCIIMGLYYIGSKKNIFHTTITVSAAFKNVGGLMPGNNVRFNGINVGTVSKIYAIADTSIKVEFTIDEESTQFISKNSMISISTDGMLGNKLINVTPGTREVKTIENGDVMQTIEMLQIDNALRTLTTTGENLKVITDNLKSVSIKFNDNNSIWHLLSDSTLAQNVRNVIVRFQKTSDNTALITGDLSQIVKNIQAGKGSVGALLTDTTFSKKLNQTIVNFESISDSIAIITGNFKGISEKLQNGNGTIGALLTDTTFVNNLNRGMENIKSGAGNFNENMEALKHTWPLKKYFKKKINK